MLQFFCSLDGLHLKTASCRLYVRLVTKEMLEKSVTIRLNNITQDTFLSPVYKFFVDALASVLNTEEKNIYVINVEKDTDVSTTVLNVSVAVRKSDGSFIDAEVLQEQIYLQRIRLADLSTLQVGDLGSLSWSVILFWLAGDYFSRSYMKWHCGTSLRKVSYGICVATRIRKCIGLSVVNYRVNQYYVTKKYIYIYIVCKVILAPC